MHWTPLLGIGGIGCMDAEQFEATIVDICQGEGGHHSM